MTNDHHFRYLKGRQNKKKSVERSFKFWLEIQRPTEIESHNCAFLVVYFELFFGYEFLEGIKIKLEEVVRLREAVTSPLVIG